MEIVLNSIKFTATATMGELFANGLKIADTLEDTYRVLPPVCPNTPKGVGCKCKEKVYGKTCIPAGRYKVVWHYSPKFKNYYPMLENVPHFIGILIHAGGNVDHTDGCILTGEEIPGQEKLKNQFEVTSKVKSMIKKALDAKEEVWITVNRK
jgi:hypothetical protein